MPFHRPHRRIGSLAVAVAVAGLWLAVQEGGSAGGAVYYVSLQGDDANPGTAERPWRHIEWAMTRPFLRGGDAIHIRAGVYRPAAEANPGRDSATDDALIRPSASGEPGRPITVMAEPGERVVLSGRVLAASWGAAGGSLYSHDYSIQASYPFDHPFQVVEDGRLLYRVSSLEAVDRPGRCFVDASARRIYAWTSDSRPPAAHLVEYGVAASAIEFRGVENWRLLGFSVTGFRTTGVMVAAGAGRIELDRMDISYIGAHRPGADPTNGHAVAMQDTSGGNRIHDCNLHHTLAEVVHVSQSGAGGDLYENNDIHEAGGAEWLQETLAGVQFGPGLILRASRTIARGNRVYSNGYHGLILESDLRGAEGPSAPTDNVIEGNVFALNGGNGIYGDGKNGTAASRGNIIRFNLFDRNNQARAGSDGDAELRLAGNLDDTLIHNNTFYGDKAHSVLIYAGRLALGTAQGADAIPDGARLVNNIAVLAGRRPLLYPLRAVDAGPGFAADYNDWYRTADGPLVSWNGAVLARPEDFRGKTGQERHGLSLDPRFVSVENGHFWLRAVSPLIGRGVADLRGDGTPWAAPADAAPPDLGAFPYRPLLAPSATELRFVTQAGGRNPAPQAIEIRSAAGRPLPWTARADPGWLRLSTPAAESPAALEVSVRAAGLAAGTYAATIQVTPALDGEPSIPVRVTLAVLPAPPRRRAF